MTAQSTVPVFTRAGSATLPSRVSSRLTGVPGTLLSFPFPFARFPALAALAALTALGLVVLRPGLARADAPPPSLDAGRMKVDVTSSAQAPAKSEAKPQGDGGVPVFPHVEGSISGGKIPDYEETVAGMRPALKACVDGKGELDAVVEITAKVGAKGAVTGSDSMGGTQFSEGAVPCLIKRIEAATFKKPTDGSPRVTFRIKMRKE